MMCGYGRRESLMSGVSEMRVGHKGWRKSFFRTGWRIRLCVKLRPKNKLNSSPSQSFCPMPPYRTLLVSRPQ